MPDTQRASNGILLRMLRILTVALCVGTLISLLLLHRHGSVHSQVPLPAFLINVYTLIPASIITVVGVWLIHAKKYLQRLPRWGMAAISTVAGCLIAAIGWYTYTQPPRFHLDLVEGILRGASDEYGRAKDSVRRVAQIDSNGLAEGYTDMLNVLTLRCKFDYGGVLPNETQLHHLTQSLEATGIHRWWNHPMRFYALGEAYSLRADLRTRLEDILASGVPVSSIEDAVRESAFYFDRAWESNSRLATPGFKAYVLRRKGNMFSRLRRYPDALKAFLLANQEPSAASWGAVIMGWVLTGRPEQAVLEGKAAVGQARTKALYIEDASSHSSLYINTAQAQWMMGEFEDALANCQEAVALQNDSLNNLYLAHALMLTRRWEDAHILLDRCLPPLTTANQKQVLASSGGLASGYILWVLADPNAPLSTQAARLYTVLGQEREPQELESASAEEVSRLLENAVVFLGRNYSLCSDFMLVRSTTEQLALLSETIRTRGTHVAQE